MTKQIHVSEDAHMKIKRLRGFLVESSSADVVDRVLIHAGFTDKFFTDRDLKAKAQREKVPE